MSDGRQGHCSDVAFKRSKMDKQTDIIDYTVELQWLEHLWDHEN